jgi:uncharacterized protein (DUF433 family)
MVVTDLITRHIQENPHKPGPGDAILRDFGVSVWILVEDYLASGSDADWVAEAWDIPREAVEAALAYYAEHTTAVDARIEAQRASFA